jgi:hypothetical protein
MCPSLEGERYGDSPNSHPSEVLQALKRSLRSQKKSTSRKNKIDLYPMGPKGAGWGCAVGILNKERTITTYRTGYLKTPIGIPPLLYRVSTRGTHTF